MPPKTALEAVGDGVWGGMKMGWRGAKATAAAGASAVDSAKQRKAEASADALEKAHRAEFKEKQSNRESGAKSALYAKHAGGVKAENTFGLSAGKAQVVKKEQAKSGLGGFFQPKPKAELAKLAAQIGWDERALGEALGALDGDMEATRALMQTKLDAMQVEAKSSKQPKPAKQIAPKSQDTERAQLLALAVRIGWDEDMLDATLDALDGDVAAARTMLEEQL
jgi:hypothetical protein